MAWTVILENANRETIKRIDTELELTPPVHLFKLLKYLDSYGDTVFNNIQMDDLIGDLKTLQQDHYTTILNEIIEISLVCKSTPHTYIVFYGD
jgi:hypothetical protein